MSKVLSVSVAAYNAEEFLRKCLDSFVAVKQHDLLEILVVDDGSKDHTKEIAEEYVKKYPDMICLIAKENGGHGSTINAALEKATGKYFRVIDSDDWVDPGDMDALLDYLKDAKTDMVLGNYREVYPDHTHELDVHQNYEYYKSYSFDEMNPKFLFAMHSICILTENLRKLGRKIPEHCFYADTSYFYNAACAADTVSFIPGCVYQYRLGREGQSVSAEGWYKHIEDFLKIERSMMDYYEGPDKSIPSKVKREYLYQIILTRWRLIFGCFLQFNKSEKDGMLFKFYQDVKNNYPELINSLYLQPKRQPVLWNLEIMLPIMRALFTVWHHVKGSN